MTSPTYVEQPALLALLGSIGDDERRGRFAHDFINLWETRSQRLMNALGNRDFEDADVVLLSIRSSSAMLGARPLEAVAGMVHSAVRVADLPGSLSHLARLNEVGELTCQELATVMESLRTLQQTAGVQP